MAEMASWRDTVSDQAQRDLDGLVDAAAEFALERISSSGEFLPFALGVSIDGEHQAIQPNYPRGRDLNVAEQLAAQWQSLLDIKDSLRAVAVAVNVVLTEANRDGIEVSVEHREGVAIGLIFPYAAAAGGGYELEPPSAHRAEPRVWS
jgi:hypothetical protein